MKDTQSANSDTALQATPATVAMLVYPGAQCLDVTGPLEVFSLANRQRLDHGEPVTPEYKIQLLAEEAGPVIMSSGIRIVADMAYRDARNIDTLLVCGGDDQSLARLRADSAVIEWLQTTSRQVRRLGSICNGALLLAEAGLLDQRKATTHWMDVPALQTYADVDVNADAIYIRDGNVFTSAGITAGIDLALAMAEEDCGRELALSLARRLVLYLKRDGGQNQYSTHLDAQSRSPRFSGLLTWVRANLGEVLDVERMAAQANMSSRHFARRFKEEMQETPVRFVERLRVEKARQLLVSAGVDSVALAKIPGHCGFTSSEQMRRAFKRHLGVSPTDYCKRFS